MDEEQMGTLKSFSSNTSHYLQRVSVGQQNIGELSPAVASGSPSTAEQFKAITSSEATRGFR
jgi:hypothetical protein